MLWWLHFYIWAFNTTFREHPCPRLQLLKAHVLLTTGWFSNVFLWVMRFWFLPICSTKILAPVTYNSRTSCFINSLLELNTVSPTSVFSKPCLCVSATMGEKLIASGIWVDIISSRLDPRRKWFIMKKYWCQPLTYYCLSKRKEVKVLNSSSPLHKISQGDNIQVKHSLSRNKSECLGSGALHWQTLGTWGCCKRVTGSVCWSLLAPTHMSWVCTLFPTLPSARSHWYLETNHWRNIANIY